MFLLGIAFYMKDKSNIMEVSADNRNIPIYSVKTDENKISLTINCAWNADDIDKILDILEKNDVKVTFFVVGDWVQKYPEAVKKINDSGHEIGNHSNTHPHVNNLDYNQNIKEIEECNQKIEHITGKRSTLYRGPYGEYNDTVYRAADSLNYTMIQWSIDTLDYNNPSQDEMWDRINKNIKNGSIVLMHNGTKNTADSLDFIIKGIKSKGYQVVPVSDLIYKSDYYVNSQGTQIKNK